MKQYLPTEQLQPYIKYYMISENAAVQQYKVLPSTGMVIGFQYTGQLSAISKDIEEQLNPAGITGLADSYKVFKSSAYTGTVLVYFTEVGFTAFATHPANELFNLSTALDNVFDKNAVEAVREKLSLAGTDVLRVMIIEHFMLSQLRDIENDRLIVEAVKLIYQRKGIIRIKDMLQQLYISQSPFEKRFRRIVGTTPKKFSSIVRFNAVLKDLKESKSLTDICYENGFFDQAHFIKDFKHFTGDTPENFKRLL